MRVMFPIAAMTLTLAAVLSTSGPAHAGSEKQSVRVSYADLDLASEAGVDTLNSRIKRATTRICGHATGDLTSRATWKACVAEAKQSAKPQMTAAIMLARREAYAEARTAR
jgi:UrcA family protein